jgi:hypothetical protein
MELEAEYGTRTMRGNNIGGEPSVCANILTK